MSKRIVSVLALSIALGVLLHCSPSQERGSDPGDVTTPEGTPVAADTLPDVIAAGQTVYVPVSSHIYSRGAKLTFDLTVTLVIRNTDRSGEIIVTRVDYHDMNGRRVREYLDSPIRIGALGTTDFVIEEQDRTGGSAPSFIVEWIADSPVSEPLLGSRSSARAWCWSRADRYGLAFFVPFGQLGLNLA